MSLLTTKTRGYQCPYCDCEINAASSTEGKRPSRGDFSICIECGGPLVFDALLRPVVPSP